MIFKKKLSQVYSVIRINFESEDTVLVTFRPYLDFKLIVGRNLLLKEKCFNDLCTIKQFYSPINAIWSVASCQLRVVSCELSVASWFFIMSVHSFYPKV